MVANNDNTEQAIQVQAKRREEAEEVIRANAHNLSLTRAERAVLEVLMNPENARLTDTQRAELAGVSRTTFYNALRKPEFHKAQVQMVQEYTARHIAPILAKSVQTATEEARDGFADRRWLAELGMFYVPKKQQDINVRAQVVGIVGVSLDDLR